MRLNPKYPVYIISKGRWDSRLTVKALTAMGVPFRVVVEPTEYDQYAAVIPADQILTLPFHDLGQGSVPARNWVWDHATAEGHDRHWIMDDNILAFYRLNRNRKLRISSGNMIRAVEDFVDRYTNVPMAGPHYHTFARARIPYKLPFYLNHRVYSCILLTNKTDMRWRGIYNEDTDLSLRFLKAGKCTVLFLAFIIHKMATMTMKGGNTEMLYKLDRERDGRYLMAESLRRQHPDVVRITRRFGRWQHLVDYRPFRNNRLIRRADVVLPDADSPDAVNEYGMRLAHRPKTK
jgi:hypothetical protein